MEFTIKDWIIMLVPVILEGIVFFIFQAYFNKKLRSFEKKIKIKEDVIHTFLGKIMRIQLEYQYIFNSKKLISENEIQPFLDILNDLRVYYLANERDLNKFKLEFEDFYNTWVDFVGFWNNHNKKDIDDVFRRRIHHQLKVCEINANALIDKIRNKGF